MLRDDCRIEAGGKEVPEDILFNAMELAQLSVKEIIDAQHRLLQSTQQEKSQIDNADTQITAKKQHFSIPEKVYEEIKDVFWKEAVGIYQTMSAEKINRGQLEGTLRAKLVEHVNAHPTVGTDHAVVKTMIVDQIMHEAFRAAILAGTSIDAGQSLSCRRSAIDKAFSSEVQSHDTPMDSSIASCRSDGRQMDEIRPISCNINVLPAVHGSSYFARGDTHVLSTVTLGSLQNGRYTTVIDGSCRELVKQDYFTLQYDFPPYCNGEIGNVTGINRRMVGHGNLAERAMRAVLPSVEQFPYTVRVLAECTSSNGSSSMASVCSASLALLDAGVPLKAPVAGLSIGLVTDPTYAVQQQQQQQQESGAAGSMSTTPSGKYVLLTDILGSEDHHGDMDFKIAGTSHGVTALQLDVKLPGGLPTALLKEALFAGKKARGDILNKMQAAIREQERIGWRSNDHIPKAVMLTVDANRLSYLVGRGGEMINFIRETFDVTIEIMPGKKRQAKVEDVVEKELVYVFGLDRNMVTEAASLIQDIAVMVKEGDTVLATVVEVKDYGVFVKINQGQEALLHLSEISHDKELMKLPLEELFKRGQKVEVQVSLFLLIHGRRNDTIITF